MKRTLNPCLYIAAFFLLAYGWSLMVQAKPKDSKEGELIEVLSMEPADKASNIPINIPSIEISAKYPKKEFDTSNFSFTIKSEDGEQRTASKLYIDNYDEDSIYIDGTFEKLKPNSKYSVEIKGILIGGKYNEISWSFTTGDWYKIDLFEITGAYLPEGSEPSPLSPGDELFVHISYLGKYKNCRLVLSKLGSDSSISLNSFPTDACYKFKFKIPDNIELGKYKLDVSIDGTKALMEKHPNVEVDLQKAVKKEPANILNKKELMDLFDEDE